MPKKAIVITTINPKNLALEKFSKAPGYDLIIVGDKKSPAAYNLKAVYLDVAKQEKMFAPLAKLLPYNHYCRKNLGYLYAIANNYQIIAESDDDNIPYKNWGTIPGGNKFNILTAPKFPNVYNEFSKEKIWPRGFPLDLVLKKQKNKKKLGKAEVLIWQGLADRNPDVDAVYRLTASDKSIKFRAGKPVVLNAGVVSAFNSQNTIWQKKAFAYLYLPHTVTFRYTDILRSFVAQAGIWKLNGRLGFAQASVYQDRNYHNLLRDFRDEVPMYNTFYRVVEILENSKLSGKPKDLLTIYQALFEQGIVQKQELASVKVWLSAIGKFL